jgi:hypothetical protein
MKQIAYALIFFAAVASPAQSPPASADNSLGDLSTGCLTSQGIGNISALPATQRALASWNALVHWFGHWSFRYPDIFAASLPAPNGLLPLSRLSGPNERPNYVWGQGQVVHAAVSLAKLARDYKAFDCLEPTLSRYLLTNKGTTGYAPPVDPGTIRPPPARWWDDNGVTALALLQAYAQLGDPKYLRAVRTLWPFFKAGQQKGGGERENEEASHPTFSTVATGSVDQTMERLYLATKAGNILRPPYRTFLLANDAWVKKTLRAPDGLYWDGYYPNIAQSPFKWCDGTMTRGVCSGKLWACNPHRADLPPPQVPSDTRICAWTWPQNQGLMIGSDVLLYRITGDRSYLQSATRTANVALTFYPLQRLWKTPPWTNSVYFEGLFQLDQYVHDPRIRMVLRAYLDRAWNQGRDPKTGLFNQGGIAVENPKVGISSLDQAAWVVMYSLLTSPASTPPPPATSSPRSRPATAASLPGTRPAC